MPPPLTLSVGIPTFNQADFLEETIESLLYQTRPPDEIVISDHYSTDRTPEIIRKYVAATATHGIPIRGIQPPPNVNLTGQYNFTLSSQTGDWITLLSSDDIARPNFVASFLDAAASRADAVLVRAGWENIDATGNSLSHNFMLTVPKVESPPATLISQQNGPRVSFAAFAIQRAAYLKSGPILESIESLADWALFLQIAPFGSFLYRHELVSGYRVGHDGNKFRDRIGMWIRDEQRIFGEIFPLAAQRAGLKDLAWIHHAARHNFGRYLGYASQEFAPAERAPIVPLFQSWAATVGMEAPLARFAAGETIRVPQTLGEKTRELLRPLAQKVVARLHRR